MAVNLFAGGLAMVFRKFVLQYIARYFLQATRLRQQGTYLSSALILALCAKIRAPH
jgi:hypothetical protein